MKLGDNYLDNYRADFLAHAQVSVVSKTQSVTVKSRPLAKVVNMRQEVEHRR
jgi:hypothetical protein